MLGHFFFGFYCPRLSTLMCETLLAMNSPDIVDLHGAQPARVTPACAAGANAQIKLGVGCKTLEWQFLLK